MSSILDTIKPKEAIKALDDLQKSLGWALVEEYLRKDMVEAVMGMGRNPDMAESEMHFRRGTIYTSQNMLKVPQQLSSIYTTQVALDESKSDTAE